MVDNLMVGYHWNYSYGEIMTAQQPTGQEPEKKQPSPYWCFTCNNQRMDTGRKKRYCNQLQDLISQEIWCFTWKLGCPRHSSRPYSPAPDNLHTCIHKEIRNDVEFCHYHDDKIKQQSERENFTSALKEWFELIRDQARNDEKYFDDLGKDYLYDRGKCAGVAIFIEQEVRRKIESLRVGKEK